jgi:AraC-like DNA-binding protein
MAVAFINLALGIFVHQKPAWLVLSLIMPLIITLLILFLAALHLFHNWRIQPHSLYLSAALGIIALLFITHYVFIYGASEFWLAVFFIHFSPLHLLLGPLLLFYVRGTLTDNHRLTLRDAWHFLPMLLDLIFRADYYFTPWSIKMDLAGQMVRDIRSLHQIGANFFPPTQVIMPIRFMSMIGYTVYSLWLVRRFRRQYPVLKRIPMEAVNPVIRFLTYMLAICLLAENSFFILVIRFVTDNSLDASHFMNDPLLIITALGIISIPVLIQIYPQVLYGIPNRRNWKKYKERDGRTAAGPLPVSQEDPGNASRVPVFGATLQKLEQDTGADVPISEFQALSDRIMQVMDEQRPWLAHDFSLDDLAKIMDVPRHHLYYCFNNILKTRFTKLRTEYRVRHAQYLIENGGTQTKTLESIGMESGFSTRGTFITSFREVTGLTPGDYLRSLESGGEVHA